jgi:hypothetical protein
MKSIILWARCLAASAICRACASISCSRVEASRSLSPG